MGKNFVQSKLYNGIETMAAQEQNLHSVCIGFYFKAGTLHETKKTNGISHLIEHLFFRKLADLSQIDLYNKMENIGTTLKAKTYNNFIGFDISVVPQYFHQAFDIIIKLLKPFTWEKNDIDKEKAVVLKQIDFKSMSFDDMIDSLYFRGTRFHMPIMGTPENVKNFSKKTIETFKNKIFNSNNTCFTITGNYSDEDYLYAINQLNKIPKNKTATLSSEKLIPISFCNRTESSDRIIDTDLEISDVSISFDIDQRQVNEYAIDLLCSILGEGDGSKLSIIIREKFALTDEVYSKVDIYPQTERITIEFSTKNSDLEKCLQLVFNEITKIKNKITEKDLLGSIVFFTDNQYKLLDSPRDLNFVLGWRYILFEQKLSGIEQLVKKYSAITVDDLLRAANEVFIPDNLIISV